MRLPLVCLSCVAALSPLAPRSIGRRPTARFADVLLDCEGLTASVADPKTEILKGLDLTVRAGEVHAIMGPNGSGKSTLAKVLARHPAYDVTGGAVTLAGTSLLEMDAQEAARAGVFLAFQYPVELPGVGNSDFLRLMVNAKRSAAGEPELDPLEFLGVAVAACETVRMDPDFLSRNVNEGFSGGEKKRNEILQMALLKPTLAVLDETDSGLDIDALRTISDGINDLRTPDNAFVLITHYQRLLDYVTPDFVHIMKRGKIVKTGGPELALELEAKGYAED
jgi:Fe-S cluster assembly ATP-binding protein